LRSLHLTDQPARLLAGVRGLDLVALPRHDECCGFGGTFAVKNADVSTAMGNDKVTNIAATKAEVCVAADNSCLMQIDGLMRRSGVPVRCMHLAEVLATSDLPAEAGSHTDGGATLDFNPSARPVASGFGRKAP
jgi:L-lactate dehydrogenase complex protein LldE